jgi:large subunit ribosomal protein L25
MSEALSINAEIRDDMGKGASRRLRHNGKIPAVIYGTGKKPVALTLNHDELFHALENEAFYSQIIEIKAGDVTQKAILKDLQRHPYKNLLVHADFMRINMKESLTTNVPLHFINEEQCIGVKEEGGQLTHLMNDVEITCLPTNIPGFVEIDVANLALGSTLHLSEITPPEGVEFSALSGPDAESHDLGLASVIKKKEEEEEVVEETDEAADDSVESGEATGDAETTEE